jgi:hypothetical protein
MTVLVAIPVGPGIPPELLDKAVRHALAQTAEVVVLAAGDGVKPDIGFRHDRLVVGTFPTNMGAPATQQAMILGSPFPWYAPHGADDWIERHHVATLLALRSKVNGSGAIYYHEGRVIRVYRSSRTYIEFGVLDTALLRAVGGYNAAEPCGQDSVLISVLVGTVGRLLRLSARPTYHKLHRENSLTHDPATRGGSELRTGVRLRNRAALAEMERIGWRNTAAIKAYRDGLVPQEIQSQLEDRVALVARWLT